MPIPKPRSNETQDGFMGRCMGDSVMVDEYDESQRFKICGTQWENREKMMKKRSEKYLEFKELKADEEKGTFEGYLSVYDVVDLGNDMVRKGAFDKTIKENDGVVPLLYMHDVRQPIGTLELKNDDHGLKVEGQLLLDIQRAGETYTLLKADVMTGLSIGYQTVRAKIVKGVRNLIELKLLDGSLVLNPMNTEAVVTGVKNDGQKVEDFDANYERLTLQSARSRMLWALGDTLDEVMWDWDNEDLSNEDKISQSDESIQQFHKAYLELLPRILTGGKMELPDAESGRHLSVPTRAKIAEVIDNLTKLVEAEDTLKDAGPTPDGAETTSDSAVDTSRQLATRAVEIALEQI